MKNDTRKWYRIKARCMDIFKPDGKVIEFWLYRENKKEVHELVLKKGYQNIKWIREGTPPFLDKT